MGSAEDGKEKVYNTKWRRLLHDGDASKDYGKLCCIIKVKAVACKHREGGEISLYVEGKAMAKRNREST